MNYAPGQKLQEQVLREINTFKKFTSWQFIFLRIYFFALFLEILTKNYYVTQEIPTYLYNTIGIIAGISLMAFAAIIAYKLIMASTIKQHLLKFNLRIVVLDFSIVLFIISMMVWIVDDLPMWIGIIIFLIVTVGSEINARRSSKALNKLKREVAPLDENS